MKFREFPYNRPDITQVEAQFDALIDKFQSAQSADEQNNILTEINDLRNNYETMEEISSINYTIDTTNEDIEKEHDHFDEMRPSFAGLINKFYNTLLSSPYRTELEQKRGKHLFALAESKVKTFKP